MFNKMVEKRKIRRAARTIVENFSPRKIILFGSHACGKQDEGSDVDLLVVLKAAKNNLDAAVAIRQAIDHDFPIDIIVRTPKQIEQRLRWGDSFIKEIMEKGEVLYEAPG